MNSLSIDLLEDLIERTQENIKKVEQLQLLPEESLNKRNSQNSWSILECIEHLNRYSDFYLPEIETRISSSLYQASENFRSGLLGNYFALSMLPKEKLNSMKTFQSMNPLGSSLTKQTLTTFIEQQQTLITLLNKAQSINLNKTKTSISISKLIKLKLGDTFRVVIFHNQRHILQAENVLAVLK